MHESPGRPRLSPFPAEGSPELERLHREFAAALDKRDVARHRPSLRLRVAQQLRRLVARLDP